MIQRCCILSGLSDFINQSVRFMGFSMADKFIPQFGSNAGVTRNAAFDAVLYFVALLL